MWRIADSNPARTVLVRNNFVRRFAPALSLLTVLTAGTAARAQTSLPPCPTGLMHRDEAASGTLLLRTTTAGCYLGAPRVAADISVDVSGPVGPHQGDATLREPGRWMGRGVYVFPLPEGALSTHSR